MSVTIQDQPTPDSTAIYVLQGKGRTYRLDETAFNAALGAALAVSDKGRALTTGQAAKMLGVSLKTVQRLLDAGYIPFYRTSEGGNRMIYESDMIAYRSRRDEQSRHLEHARKAAQEIGLYGMPTNQQREAR